MSLSKSKYDIEKEEAKKKLTDDIALLGESIVVHVDSLPRTLSCSVHGEYQTTFIPNFKNTGDYLRSCFSGEKPPTNKEIIACPSCKAALEDAYNAELKAIDAKEAADRKEIGYRNWIEKAGVAARHSFFTLDQITPANQKQESAISIAKNIVERLKSGEQAPNLIMTGSVGTGKSLIASAAVQSAIRSNLDAKISTVMNLIRMYRATWKKDCDYSENDVINELTTVDLLVLDEVGVQYGSDSEKMFVFDVIDGRYRNMLPTIIASNLNMDGIKECVGERCVDRMREDGGKVVAFDFESQRGKK